MKERVLGTVLAKLYVEGLSEFQGLKAFRAFRVSGVVSEIYEKNLVQNSGDSRV